MPTSRELSSQILVQQASEEFVCGECVNEAYLKLKKIEHLLRPRICYGCGNSVHAAFSIPLLVEQCRNCLPNFYEPNDGLYRRPEFHLRDLLSQSLSCASPKVLDRLVQLLEVEDEADEDVEFSEDDESGPGEFFSAWQSYQCQSSPFDDEDHERWYVLEDWRRVAADLSHGRRFFNQGAGSLFEAIIAEAMSAIDESIPSGRPAIKLLSEGETLFRARIAQNFEEQEDFRKSPSKSLGAPPRTKASNGRMSAAGIPCLYLSADKDTCVAEVRPSIGDVVVVGRFECTRQLRLFDLTAFSRPGPVGKYVRYQEISIFDPAKVQREMVRRLLAHLHIELGRPVKVHDTDYLMTQALAEYIRYYDDGYFDGIAFRSVQRVNGVNCTLFDRRAEVEQSHLGFEPQFDVRVDPFDVEMIEITAVEYSMSSVHEF